MSRKAHIILMSFLLMSAELSLMSHRLSMSLVTATFALICSLFNFFCNELNSQVFSRRFYEEHINICIFPEDVTMIKQADVFFALLSLIIHPMMQKRQKVPYSITYPWLYWVIVYVSNTLHIHQSYLKDCSDVYWGPGSHLMPKPQVKPYWEWISL